MKKHIDQQKQRYHNFIDLKKLLIDYDMMVWNVMMNMGINIELINIIKSLYYSTISYIILTNKSGLPFPMIIGLRLGFLLSPVLFNIFLEIIMQDTLENHQFTI